MSESASQTMVASVAPPIEGLLHLIQPVAKSIHARLPSFVDYDDLYQVGYLGLEKALEKLDPNRIQTLDTYAQKKIRGAILDYLRKLDPTSRDSRRQQKKLIEVIRSLADENGCVPESSQVAEAFGISLVEYRELELKLADNVFHLEQFAVLDKEEPDQIIDPADKVSLNAEQTALQQERSQLIYSALEQLADRDRVVLLFYMQNDFTMKEVGALMGVNESRISQIILRARRILAPIFYAYRLGTY